MDSSSDSDVLPESEDKPNNKTPDTNLKTRYTNQGDVSFDKELVTGDEADETSDVVFEQKKYKKHLRRTSTLWKYFKDKGNGLATCVYCSKDFSYKSSISNLKKHLHRHGPDLVLLEEHAKVSEDDKSGPGHGDTLLVESDASIDYEVQRVYEEDCGRRKRSPLWYFFKELDKNLRISQCRICKKRLSYNTFSNLRRHLSRRHPKAAAPKLKEGAEVIIGPDGQFYEVETNGSKFEDTEDNDDQNNTPEMDPIYLDDDYEDKFEVINLPQKRKRPTIHKNRTENVVHSDITVVNNEPDCLTHFANYITSLLRQLPKAVSDNLQADMVKQIMTAKISSELSGTTTVTPNNGYSITIRNNDQEIHNGTAVTNTVQGQDNN